MKFTACKQTLDNYVLCETLAYLGGRLFIPGRHRHNTNQTFALHLTWEVHLDHCNPSRGCVNQRNDGGYTALLRHGCAGSMLHVNV